MFAQNFWHWLIEGFKTVMDLIWFNHLPFHQDWGISSMFVGNMANSVVIVMTFIGTFVRLESLGLFVGLVMMMETPRTLYAIYRWIVGLIPVP